LRIDEKQRYKTIAFDVFGSNGSLNPHVRVLGIGRAVRQDSIYEIDRKRTSARDSLPYLDRHVGRFGADDVAFAISNLSVYGLRVLVFVNADILSPAGFDLDPVDIAVDTERQSEARRDERLIARCVDFVGGIRLCIDVSGAAVEFRTGIVACAVDIQILRLLSIFGGKRPFEALDTPTSASRGASFPTR
jgi:hypothetical protein